MGPRTTFGPGWRIHIITMSENDHTLLPAYYSDFCRQDRYYTTRTKNAQRRPMNRISSTQQAVTTIMRADPTMRHLKGATRMIIAVGQGGSVARAF
ncbi:hypothetical protein [Absidia glauca]|uniref:Uncharacterized protein n=1 Tax=Absidia glauca TaxID=4829 RepID=A0A163JPM4_ABSGL|nr:hypothetical protein [Absidia glauca]